MYYSKFPAPIPYCTLFDQPVQYNGGLHAGLFQVCFHLFPGMIGRGLSDVDPESFGVLGGALDQIGDDAGSGMRENGGAIAQEFVSEMRDSIPRAGALAPEIGAPFHQHLLRLFEVRLLQSLIYQSYEPERTIRDANKLRNT